MPWLSRRSSAEGDIKATTDDLKHCSHHSTTSMIRFIPAQVDGSCGTMPAHHRQAGLRLMWADVRFLIQNLGCLPAMAKAAFSTKVLRNLLKNPLDARDTALQFCLAIIQIWMLAVIAPAFMLLPGFLFAGLLSVFWLLTLAMTWPLSGPRVVTSYGEESPLSDGFPQERWIYVNGMMCSNRSLRSQCTQLSSIFGCPIIGIHSRTSGLVIDLLMLLIQRCWNVPTPCTLTLNSQIRDACLTDSVRRAVLIGHSTGALHISIALDQLHASLPVEMLSKLEVYTFGSAAAHISNPRLNIDHHNTGTGISNHIRTSGSVISPAKATFVLPSRHIEDNERVIPHMEHYVLESDILARYGVIQNTRNALDNRFCGRVFVLDDKTMMRPQGSRISTTGGGFMLNEHYLDLFFSADPRRSVNVLDQVVEVEIETAERREFTAQGVALPQKSLSRRACSHLDSSEISPKSKHRMSWENTAALGPIQVRRARSAAKECEGKTVKQLSRLWMYVNGGRPLGEGVAVVNGIGKRPSDNGLGMVQ